MRKGIGLLLGLALIAMMAAGCNQGIKAENESLKAANESLTTQVSELQAKVDEATKQATEITQQRDACQAELTTLKASAPAPAAGGTAAQPAK